MKTALIQKITPITESFVDKLMEIHQGTLQKTEDLIKEIEKTKMEQESLRVQKAENLHQLELAKDKLAEERARQLGLNSQIKDELARYNNLNSELTQKSSTTEDYLKSAKVERDLVADALERAKKMELTYTNKLESLKKDSGQLERLRSEMKEKENNLKSRETALNKDHEESAVRANALNDLDLNLKVERKEIDRLVKRYNLEAFLKEK